MNMEFMEFSAKTVNDAVTEACKHFTVPSDKLEYEVIEEGSTGFLGFNSKPAVIKARIIEEKLSVEDQAKKFLQDVFQAMNMVVVIDAKFDETENALDVELSGDEMGVLIGKRGQTLDSLQYLISLVVNKGTDEYIRVKVDTSYRVKRTKRPVSLEPMNPYERRIIHSALQNDRFVTTHSEGEEPYRRVVVTLKR